MRITIFDYGAGNLHSIAKAITVAAGAPKVESDPFRALETDVLVLPGVGAFAPAAARLAPAREAIRAALQAGLPCLGVCLGMQLLLSGSDEGPGQGIALIPGRVTKVRDPRVPQIGWNVVAGAGEPLLDRAGLEYAYYANSFACRPADPASVTSWSTYGADRFPATVRVERTLGVQFHPEKSSKPGIEFLAAFFAEARS